MISLRDVAGESPQLRPFTGAVVWPLSGTSAPDTLDDTMGPRNVPWQTPLGHQDNHGGIDVDANDGDEALAVTGGAVCRVQSSHFGFDTASQLDQWTLVSGSGAASVATSALRVTGDGVANLYRLERHPVLPNSDWTFDLGVPSAYSFDVAGKTRVTLRLRPSATYHPGSTEKVDLTYDGSTVSVDFEDSIPTTSAATASTSSALWLRIENNSGTCDLQYATDADGESWTSVASVASVFTGDAPTWYLEILLEVDASSSPGYVEVDFAGGGERGITRYGNFVSIANGDETWTIQHLREIDPVLLNGLWRDAGERIGWIGSEGFGAPSQGGRVKFPHPHVERRPDTTFFLQRSDALHPLTRLPRTVASYSVTVVRDEVNDPNGVASHRLTITSTQPLATGPAVNEISLTADLGTGTLNYETLVGFNPADYDDESFGGIYVGPENPTESVPYNIAIYYHKSVFGATFTSAYVKDPDGVTLWSE